MTCGPVFAFPVIAALTIVVVEDIELNPSNNPAREGLRLPTYGLSTKEIAHPCAKTMVKVCNDEAFYGDLSGILSLTKDALFYERMTFFWDRIFCRFCFKCERKSLES